MLYESGGRFEGEWKNDHTNGKGFLLVSFILFPFLKGKFFYPNGGIFDGDFVTDNREGHGIIIFISYYSIWFILFLDWKDNLWKVSTFTQIGPNTKGNDRKTKSMAEVGRIV